MWVDRVGVSLESLHPVHSPMLETLATFQLVRIHLLPKYRHGLESHIDVRESSFLAAPEVRLTTRAVFNCQVARESIPDWGGCFAK